MKCLEGLSGKREAINKEILAEEEEKKKLENDMRIFADRLSRINESLGKKIAARSAHGVNGYEIRRAEYWAGSFGRSLVGSHIRGVCS